MINKYKIEYTTKFKKSYKKLVSQSQYNESDFIEVLKMLANDIPLPAKYKNHLLEPKSNRFMGMPYKT